MTREGLTLFGCTHVSIFGGKLTLQEPSSELGAKLEKTDHQLVASYLGKKSRLPLSSC
jgi:hypothetical protein